MTDELLEAGRQVLEQQPFSKLIGATLEEFGSGCSVVRVPLRPELLQQYGYAHGGVLSFLADNALTFAGGSVLGTAVITVEYKVSFLAPGKGEALVARAEVIHSTARQAVCRCDIFAVKGGQETLCATALGTIYSYPAKAS